jgi:hypothetical protein
MKGHVAECAERIFRRREQTDSMECIISAAPSTDAAPSFRSAAVRGVPGVTPYRMGSRELLSFIKANGASHDT